MKEPWAFGRGARLSKAFPVTYGQLQYFFPGKKFRRLQAAQRDAATAQDCLDSLRWEYAAEIQARLPARPRQRRRTSLEASLASSVL